MTINLTKSQKEIQKAALAFAKGEFDKDEAVELDQEQAFPESVLKKAAELGFIGMHFDEAHGGGGLELLDSVIAAESFCRKDSGMGSALMLSGYGAECLHQFGDETQKELFLPRISEGEIMSGCALFEPKTGFDLSKTQTLARRDASGWEINGEKTDVINGMQADIYLTLCCTDPDAPPEKGFSLFIVKPEDQGVELKSLGKALGNRMISRAKMKLTHVHLPEENLVGIKGKGIAYLNAFFNHSRILTAAMALGMAQGAMDRALAYIKQREQFNRKIARFEVLRHKTVEMAIQIETARLITYQAATDWNWKKPDEKRCCMAKLTATRTAVNVADEAIQLLGGYGYMTEYEIERFYRDAKAMSLFEQPELILKNLTAESIIGRIKN